MSAKGIIHVNCHLSPHYNKRSWYCDVTVDEQWSEMVITRQLSGYCRGEVSQAPCQAGIPWKPWTYLPPGHTHTPWTYPPPASDTLWSSVETYPPPCEQTDTCENITFLQLHLLVVKISLWHHDMNEMSHNSRDCLLSLMVGAMVLCSCDHGSKIFSVLQILFFLIRQT